MYDPNMPTSFGYRDGERPSLKTCPFCGSAPDTFEDGEIQCSNKKCPVRPSARWGGVEVWNTRTVAAPADNDAESRFLPVVTKAAKEPCRHHARGCPKNQPDESYWCAPCSARHVLATTTKEAR